MTDAELAAEQRFLDAAYERLDALRDAARRVAAGYAEPGGTHQARLEREAAEAHTRRRLAALELRDLPLCFGRIDLAGASHPADGDRRYYIGRISVTDDGQEPLVVDWRAPVAEPFYRATAREPMGVVRRRHFQTHGRILIGLDDEVFDADASEEAGFTVVGEGALLAALERERTGRMTDIVATIQSEQDEAIRADLAGALVVTGGPGTGKTAVALHRAAYLLYTHRQRLAAQGMLLVGPSPVFLRYIDEVLPSLGEDEVQLATMSALKPQHRVRATESPAVSITKGDARMARVIAHALRDREHPLRRDLVVTVDGFRLVLSRAASRRIVERARRRRGTHNAKRPGFVSAVIDHLKARYRRALVREYERGAQGSVSEGTEASVAVLLARGEPPPADWDADLTSRIRSVPQVRAALERMWPVLSGAELVRDLFGFDALIRSAADGILSRDEQRGLARARRGDIGEVEWTAADIPLIDEADARLGAPSAARRRPRRRRGPSREELQVARRVLESSGAGGFLTAEQLVERYGGSGSAASDDDHELRTFGHVLVDEAQDLSAMEWRMLARRCPSGSFTLVGDLGQASRPGALADWAAIGDALGKEPRSVNLSVNYRTPAEIMTVAARVLAAAAPGVEPPRSVRATGVEPRFVRDDDLVGAVRDVARAAVDAGGRVAVITPPQRRDTLLAALGDLDAAAGPGAIDAPVAVLAPIEAKGLEFDHVLVVEPAELVVPDAAGLRLLYVALTRATRHLVVAHTAPLPEALQPA